MDPRRTWETSLLALTLWREARGEPRVAKVAVACSIMNRVARPSWWGRTVNDVLRKAWQYSSLTDPHDRQLTLWPPLDEVFVECLEVAALAIDGKLEHPVPGADSYHDLSIRTPKAMGTGRFCGQVGRLMFFDVDHDYERAVLAHAG